MVLALGDQPTIRLPRVPGPGSLRRGQVAASPTAGSRSSVAPAPIVRSAPSMTGPLLRALLPALLMSALAGLVLRGPTGVAIGATVPMIAAAVALWKLCRVADRGY